MTEKINLKNSVINGEEQPTVDARELWQALESKQQFSDWIKNRIADFEEGIDFTVHKIMNGENKGRFPSTEYTLTLDTAKHLCMIERNEAGKKIRKYFIEIEKEYYKIAKECNNCQQHFNYEEETVITDPSSDLRKLQESTIKLLDMMNAKLLSGVKVDRNELLYAWNVGKLFKNDIARALPDDPFVAFVMSLEEGKFRRDEIYDMYCQNFTTPVSQRCFWPRVRAIRKVVDLRNAKVRYVIF